MLKEVATTIVKTDYFMDEDNKVVGITFTDAEGGQKCNALLRAGTEEFNFQSRLAGDADFVKADRPMSLANCILAAHVHLGVIPPHNFDPIDCPVQH